MLVADNRTAHGSPENVLFERKLGASAVEEIARIQNAIALAEEDLKQIDALNAQASRLEKKLPAK